MLEATVEEKVEPVEPVAEALAAVVGIREALVLEVIEGEPPRLGLLGLAKLRTRKVLKLVKVRTLVAIVDRTIRVWLRS